MNPPIPHGPGYLLRGTLLQMATWPKQIFLLYTLFFLAQPLFPKLSPHSRDMTTSIHTLWLTKAHAARSLLPFPWGKRTPIQRKSVYIVEDQGIGPVKGGAQQRSRGRCWADPYHPNFIDQDFDHSLNDQLLPYVLLKIKTITLSIDKHSEKISFLITHVVTPSPIGTVDPLVRELQSTFGLVDW